jgi:hypothetical protein
MSRRDGMSEYQVRTRLYDPPEAVRRVDSKLAFWKNSGARMRGEDVRQAFERRLSLREPDPAAQQQPAAEVVAAPTQSARKPNIRLIA